MKYFCWRCACVLVLVHLGAGTHAHLDASGFARDQVPHFVAIPKIEFRLKVVDKLDTQKMHARNIITMKFDLVETLQTKLMKNLRNFRIFALEHFGTLLVVHQILELHHH